MLYFDRQMQRIQAGFNELNQQMSEKEVQVLHRIIIISLYGEFSVYNCRQSTEGSNGKPKNS